MSRFCQLSRPDPGSLSLSGCWSRRIDEEHRLVYQVQDEKIRLS
ncbi:Txe/YoeB family addiction module toxin, partial [Candidatus Uhrbacteria bacterium]|nr:Txe/YoeB family addiction module toxin [Candidatus Uhrbacteria bacterium]